jgi:hypothetical protein
MHDERTAVPDTTAVRVALWRAMHVQVDVHSRKHEPFYEGDIDPVGLIVEVL